MASAVPLGRIEPPVALVLVLFWVALTQCSLKKSSLSRPPLAARRSLGVKMQVVSSAAHKIAWSVVAFASGGAMDAHGGNTGPHYPHLLPPHGCAPGFKAPRTEAWQLTGAHFTSQNPRLDIKGLRTRAGRDCALSSLIRA